MKKSVKNTQELCNNIKHAHICLIGFKEGENEKGTDNSVKEIMAEYFPSLGMVMDIQTHVIKYSQATSN